MTAVAKMATAASWTRTPTSTFTPTTTVTVSQITTPTETHTSTPTKTKIPTKTSTPIKTSTEIPTATSDQIALCKDSKDILEKEISPNGKWVTGVCYWEEGEFRSYLQIVSVDSSKEWRIYFCDYAVDNPHLKSCISTKDLIVPYHWSEDERFLYAVSPARWAGCCWLGRYVLLVRINLETGEQVELLKFQKESVYAEFPISFAITGNDRYLIYVHPFHKRDLFILDLLTWKTQTVKIKISQYWDADHFELSPDNTQLAMTTMYYDSVRNAETFSIGIINLETGLQYKILEKTVAFYPVRWINNDHVIIKMDGRFYNLNVNTGEIIETENPE